MSSVAIGSRPHVARRAIHRLDPQLTGAALLLLVIGVVMVASASITTADRQLGQPFYYLIRQSLYAGLGLSVAVLVLKVPLAFWERHGPKLLLLAVAMLILVLIPGVGRTVNGSTRWLPMGLFNMQVSEPAKLCALLYLSGYMLRHHAEVRTRVSGFIKPMGVVCGLCFLLMLEPDFGASVVLLATTLGMLFLAGVRLWQFGLLAAAAGAALAVLAVSSPYRMQRLTTFLNPWADPFDSGFQLTQALIAFGRGEWFGAGLGGSIQKLFYLPEAHTDFLFAVIAEELGLLGVVLVLILYAVVIWRIFAIGAAAHRANRCFGGCLCYGVGLWISLQAFINMGVNMGVLPTKGLTLPLMSFGGSSVVVMCIALALVLRVDHETRLNGAVA
jgi:cell division protein FtsW